MASATVRIERALTVNIYDCPWCGVEYGLTAEYEARRRKDGARFHCPNGHGISFDGTHERELAEAKKQAESARTQARDLQRALDATMDTLRAEQKAAAALKKRVSNGVCPDCHRTFKNLALHTRSKHKGAVEAAQVAKEMSH
jgi:hypothetical protein